MAIINVPTPGRPGACNAVGRCFNPVVARVITGEPKHRYADDMCAKHVKPYIARILRADNGGNVIAITRLPAEIVAANKAAADSGKVTA